MLRWEWRLASEQHTRKRSDNTLQTKFMEEEEGEKSPAPASSMLQRLDRLDHLLQVLEERQSLSARYPSGLVAGKIRAKEQDHCKTISSALEEAHHKGTLMNRVAMLEDRVLQLSLEIEAGNISKSSYSVIPTTTENFNQGTSADSKEHQQENPHPLSTQEKGYADEEACAKKTKTAGSHKGKRWPMLRRSKWLCVVG